MKPSVQSISRREKWSVMSDAADRSREMKTEMCPLSPAT